jgi:hypothetical protein
MTTEKPETIWVCPICGRQGILSPMEGREGDDFIKCAVYGDISLKYFHDIFIENFYKNRGAGRSQRRDSRRRSRRERCGSAASCKPDNFATPLNVGLPATAI